MSKGGLNDPKAKSDPMKGMPFAKKISCLTAQFRLRISKKISCLTAQFRLRIRQLIYVSISSYNRKEHA